MTSPVTKATARASAPIAAPPPLWPLQRDCDAFYGDPRGRDGRASAKWEAQNLVLVKTPFPIYYDGQPARMRVHRKCADPLQQWLSAVWANAGRDPRIIHDWGMDDYNGAYNFRLMRGGRAISMHSYGCAWDFNAARNGQHDRTPHFATLREQVVAPFVALGGVWGGDWDGDSDSLDERSCDGMHFQFARVVA